jgi:hypothetical protein
MFVTAADSVSVSTVVISVLSSATVGGIIVAVLTGRYERDQQLREKMLGAAAEFATSIAKLQAQLQSIDQGTKEGLLDSRARDAAMAEYESLWGQASAQLVLVQMLYHPQSMVNAAAGKIWQHTPPPQLARQFPGDPVARQHAMTGRIITAEDIRYAMNFSYYFAGHVWEAIDSPRRLHGRRSRTSGLAAALRPAKPLRSDAPKSVSASERAPEAAPPE